MVKDMVKSDLKEWNICTAPLGLLLSRIQSRSSFTS